jgi:hypothetical protein
LDGKPLIAKKRAVIYAPVSEGPEEGIKLGQLVGQLRINAMVVAR